MPCSKNCDFCAFAEKHRIVRDRIQLDEAEVVRRAREFERAGGNAILLMTTADHDFSRLLCMGRSVRRSIGERMPLVANIGDFGLSEAEELREAGFTAAYHVRRLGEGTYTLIDPGVRESTLRAVNDAGLDLSYCLEPIWPEHTVEEPVDAMFLGREYKASVMAVMRRVPIPGTPLFQLGQVREVEMARAAAVTRLVMGNSIRAMGVHEPSILSLMSGANQIYAESGPNPRDTEGETSRGRGKRVEFCRTLLWEAGLNPFHGPAASLQGPLRQGEGTNDITATTFEGR